LGAPGKQGLLLLGQGLIQFRVARVSDKERRCRGWWGGDDRTSPHGRSEEEETSVEMEFHAVTPDLERGMTNRTVVPLPTSLSIQIRPRCASTTFFAKANPSPLPASTFLPCPWPW